MLDTLRVAIPISAAQHKRIHAAARQRDEWTYALHNQHTGDLLIKHYQGVAQMDGESYHREIRFTYNPVWSEDCRLWIEFSVPKYFMGHNIRLLYNWPKALEDFRTLLNEQFKLSRTKLPEAETWEVWRADACYGFQFPTQPASQAFLDSLKRHRFPYKQATIYKTAILFPGSTYSFKVYLKQPEFMKHDRKELLKRKASLDWVEYLETISEGVLRVEATLRRKYLQRCGIHYVQDLANTQELIEWDSKYAKLEGFSHLHSLFVVSGWTLHQKGVDLNKAFMQETRTEMADGCYYAAPDMELDFNGHIYKHSHGGFTYHKKPFLELKLRELLNKFLGGVQGMETVDRLETKLRERYKPAVATKLVSFWLYVQKFGSEKAKEAFGANSYYYQRRQIKAAGGSLMECDENLIKVDSDFFTNFKFTIPSSEVVNRFDDFRNSGNLLNLRPSQEGQAG